MKNGATIDDLQTLISNLSAEYELDPVLEDEGLIVVYPKEDEPEGAEDPDREETDSSPVVREDLDTPEPEEGEESDESDGGGEPEGDEDEDELGDVGESGKPDLADGSTGAAEDDAGDEPDDDDGGYECPDCGKEFDEKQYRNVHRSRSKSCGGDTDQEKSDQSSGDSDPGLDADQVEEDDADDDSPMEERAERIEEAMTGAGKMTSSEVADEADLDSTTEFHNTRASVDWLAEKIESEPIGEGTGKLYWIPDDGEDQEPEEGESESADGYTWYTDHTPGAVLQVEPVEKFRCGSCGEEFEDEDEVIDHMQEEGHRLSWDVKSRQDPADLLD